MGRTKPNPYHPPNNQPQVHKSYTLRRDHLQHDRTNRTTSSLLFLVPVVKALGMGWVEEEVKSEERGMKERRVARSDATPTNHHPYTPTRRPQPKDRPTVGGREWLGRVGLEGLFVLIPSTLLNPSWISWPVVVGEVEVGGKEGWGWKELSPPIPPTTHTQPHHWKRQESIQESQMLELFCH